MTDGTIKSRTGVHIEDRIIDEPSPGERARKRMFSHVGFMIGGFVLLVIIALAFLAPLISPHDPLDQQLARKLIPPIWHDHLKVTWAHPLGTDQFGRDYLSRLIHGSQISLLIGFSASPRSKLVSTFTKFIMLP